MPLFEGLPKYMLEQSNPPQEGLRPTNARAAERRSRRRRKGVRYAVWGTVVAALATTLAVMDDPKPVESPDVRTTLTTRLQSTVASQGNR